VYTDEDESPVRNDSSIAQWNSSTPIYAARTRFFPLRPERLGTPLVESLSSYIAALAKEHSTKTSDFLKMEIIPLSQHASDGPRESRTPSRTTMVKFPVWKELNSFGPITTRIASALENGTGVEDIHRMTLSSLEGIIAQALHHPYRRWCPLCLEEFRNSGRVFEPLLWSLSLVSICSIHKAQLQSSCQRCSRNSSHLQEGSVPGHCPWCGIWEGEAGVYPAETVNVDAARKVRESKAVGEFLAQVSSSSLSVDAFILERNLRRCIEVCTGNIAAFSRVLGVSSALLPRKLRRVVSLQSIVSIASSLQLSVSVFFEEDEVTCEEAWRRAASLIDRSVLSKRLLHPSWLKERLTEAATESPPPSLGTVAKRYGYTSSTMLRRRAPELCDAIAQNYLGSVQSGEQRWTFPGNISRQIDLQAALEAELSKDAPRTIEEIAHSLGYAAARSLRDVAPQMCKHIAKKRSDERKSARLQRKRALSMALKEEPAPSLEELRVRLGLRSSDHLRWVDEELCKSLRQRYRTRLAKERDGVRSLIEGCLKQSNPRWKTIEHDTGWIRSLIKKHFPDLYEKAKILCKETWDNESESDLNAAEARVRHAVEQLQARGIQPSIQNVYRTVPKGPYLGTNWIERILRKIRQEADLTSPQAEA
jgi:hypothetical protein